MQPMYSLLIHLFFPLILFSILYTHFKGQSGGDLGLMAFYVIFAITHLLFIGIRSLKKTKWYSLSGFLIAQLCVYISIKLMITNELPLYPF